MKNYRDNSRDWVLLYTYFRKTGRKEREREEELPYIRKLLILRPSVLCWEKDRAMSFQLSVQEY